MGEARKRRDAARERLLIQADQWTFAPSDWEAALVEELLDMPLVEVERMPADDIAWMRMPANECHANTRWYEANDPTGLAKSVTGWWLQNTEFVLHSILGHAGQYRCITPSTMGETSIRFIPDAKIEWVQTGDVLSPRRNGQFVGMGIRRFPRFTIALHETVRDRLAAGMSPDRADEFTREEIDALKDAHLSVEELASLA